MEAFERRITLIKQLYAALHAAGLNNVTDARIRPNLIPWSEVTPILCAMKLQGFDYGWEYRRISQLIARPAKDQT